MRHWLSTMSFCRILPLLLLLCTGNTSAQGPSKQYQIMAGFLLHFSSYVYWPQKPEVLTYCIVGTNPFGDYLQQVLTASAEKSNKKPIALAIMDDNVSAKALSVCHLIYAQQNSYKQIWGKMTNTATQLLVSDHESFIQQGGMVNFYQENQKLRFEVNLNAVQTHGLTISAQLLQLAKIHR